MRTIVLKDCVLRERFAREHIQLSEGQLIVCNPKNGLPICTVGEHEFFSDTVFDVAIVLVPHLKVKK